MTQVEQTLMITVPSTMPSIGVDLSGNTNTNRVLPSFLRKKLTIDKFTFDPGLMITHC